MVVALAITYVVIPSAPNSGGRLASQARYALGPRVLALLGLCVTLFGATYCLLTFISPFLRQITGISGSTLGVFLLVYGVAAAFGSSFGGRFADRDAARTLLVAALGTAAALGGVHLGGSHALLMAALLPALGVFTMGAGPALQYRVVDLAGQGRELAQSLPASAINLGIALGAWISGWAIDVAGIGAAPLAGLATTAAAVILAWATSRLRSPTSPTQGAHG